MAPETCPTPGTASSTLNGASGLSAPSPLRDWGLAGGGWWRGAGLVPPGGSIRGLNPPSLQSSSGHTLGNSPGPKDSGTVLGGAQPRAQASQPRPSWGPSDRPPLWPVRPSIHHVGRRRAERRGRLAEATGLAGLVRKGLSTSFLLIKKGRRGNRSHHQSFPRSGCQSRWLLQSGAGAWLRLAN